MAATEVRPLRSAGPPLRPAYIGLGGNVGDVPAALASAVRALSALPFSRLVDVSGLFRTRAVGAPGPDYLNAVVQIDSALGPGELLRTLLDIEQAHDRQRPFPHAPRTLDLDLLWYDGTERQSPGLTLPHPRMLQRAFVLEPLADVLTRHPNSRFGLPDANLRGELAQTQGIEALGPWFSA